LDQAVPVSPRWTVALLGSTRNAGRRFGQQLEPGPAWRPWLAAAILLAAVFGLQWATGAYAADFGRYPDEPSHFVTGLMVAEYLRAPTADPMGFAEQYYLHYPKVGIGQWPPLLYALEGAWFLVWGGTRGAALALHGLLAAVFLFSIYAAARTRATFLVSLAAPCLLLCTPPMMRSATMIMADTLTACLLLAACAPFASYLRRPRLTASLSFGLLLAAAMLTKGSALPLVAVPALSLLFTRRFYLLRRLDFWLSWLPLLLFAAPWYLFALRFDSPNYAGVGVGNASLSLQLYGFGFTLLALAAAAAVAFLPRRAPDSAVLLSLVAAFVAAPAAIAAFNESRHYLPAAGACAILAAWWIAERRRPALWAAAALALLLALDLRSLHYDPARFAPLAARLTPGAVVLVSGSGRSEGALIAAFAAREPRPSTLVLRASRLLAHSDWNGKRYRLLVASPTEVRAQLQNWGVDYVVQDSNGPAPHDETLRAALAGWRLSHAPGGLLLAAPPRPSAPRPISLYQERLGRTIHQTAAH
jgi:hypothetical protein